MRLRRPTARELRVGLPVLVPLVVVATFVVRGYRTAAIPHLSPPRDAASAPPPSTAPIDLTSVSLAGVDGTTTTAPARATGTARLTGVVSGPQGPVPGATVRIEHLVDPVTSSDVAAGTDGRYDVAGIAGGRYRVRAFLPPLYAQTEPAIFFLADGEQRTVDLTVQAFSGLAVTSAIAPDPPQLREPSSLVVRVARQTVDGDGIVRDQPIANAVVALTSMPGWEVSGPSSAFTTPTGDATFQVACRTPGANQFGLQVRENAAAVPVPETVTVSACVAPATTTTSSPSSSSSSSQSSGPRPTRPN